MDYASFLLEAKKNLKSYEEAMVNKNFKEAKEYAFNLLAEVRLLEVIARKKKKKR